MGARIAICGQELQIGVRSRIGQRVNRDIGKIPIASNVFAGGKASLRGEGGRQSLLFTYTHIHREAFARFEGGMKRFKGFNGNGRHVLDSTMDAMERMESYCAAHPGSPCAARRPSLLFRGQLWIALLGPTVEEGIVGIGQTVEAALRAFDAQYLAGLRPPAQALRRAVYDSKLSVA